MKTRIITAAVGLGVLAVVLAFLTPSCLTWY